VIMIHGTLKEFARPYSTHHAKNAVRSTASGGYDMFDECSSIRSTIDIQTSIMTRTCINTNLASLKAITRELLTAI
jgi:hypothetical protein